MMDLLLTHSFVSVAQSGSITDAAEQLGLTQSALSRRIQQYECQLGARLLTRSRKGVELTEIGRLVVQQGLQLLAQFEKLQEEIARQQGLEGGQVRIGGGATAVSFILPEAIARFGQDHPKVMFQMVEAGSNEIADGVLNGKLEIGIVTLPLQSRDLRIQTLTTDHIVLVARRDHPLTGRERVTVDDLAGHRFVSFEGGSALRNIIDNAVRARGVELQVVMELRAIPSILRMVSTTGHLAFVSRIALHSQTDVVQVPVQGLGIERKIAVISRRHGMLSVAAEAFVQQLLSGA